MLGPFVFGNPLAQPNATSNRAMLVELCPANKMMVGKTFLDEPAERQITCYDIGARPVGSPVHNLFRKLDIVLLSKDWASDGSIK